MSSSIISTHDRATASSLAPLAGEQLERRLEELLHQDRFAPPPEFVATERVDDASLHARAELDPNAFWAEQARDLHWDKPFTTVLDDSNPPFYRWFTDGKLNVSYNCLDRHVEAGHGNRVAFHWAGEEGEQRAITYAELHREVQRLANALKELGVGKGDIVGIYLPMIPEVVVAMLACARIGAPHNVVFGGFAPEAVKERMEVSHAKVLITVDGARRKGKTAPVKAAVDAALGDLESLEHIVVVRHTGIDTPMTQDRDVFYDEILAAADPFCPAEPMEAEHPLFILYSSGSTAKPKGILHTSGGYLTGVSSTHRYVFDLDPERDVFFCSADVGWMTGHSYIVYGPLANGATSVMYEGAPDYPDKGIWWELVERYGVTIFYTAPTAIRACMKWGAEHPNAHDLSSLRLLGTVGEPINPKAWLWYHVVIGRERCPIVDTWWQTETGQIMISPLPGLTETKPGSATFPLPGVLADVVDETTGESIEQGQGLLVLKRPGPECCAPCTATTSATSRRTSRGSATTPTSSATPRSVTRTATCGSSAGSTTSSTSPGTASQQRRSSRRSSRTTTSPKPQSSPNQTNSPARRSSRTSPSRETSRVPQRSRPRSAITSPRKSASSPGQSASCGARTCPRHARGRSCAAC